jgi:transposase
VKHHSAYNPRVADTHDLPDDVPALKRLVLEHRRRDQAHLLEIERLKIQLSRLRRWKFGRSSEQLQLQITQLEMSLEALQAVTPEAVSPQKATEATPQRKSQPTPRRQHSGRKALPAHLPRETIYHLHPVIRDKCACPDCGGRLRKMPQDDVSEMLEYVPGYFKVIRHVREKHSCARCSRILQAAAPSRPIERGLPGPNLLAHVVAAKFCSHQPLYRQSQVYGYAGVSIDRSTLSQWVGAGTELTSPLVQAVRRYVLGGQQVHADDTPCRCWIPGEDVPRPDICGLMCEMNDLGVVPEHRQCGLSTHPTVVASILASICASFRVWCMRMRILDSMRSLSAFLTESREDNSKPGRGLVGSGARYVGLTPGERYTSCTSR